MSAVPARPGLDPPMKRALLSVLAISTAIAAFAFALSLLHPRYRLMWLFPFAVGLLAAMLIATSLTLRPWRATANAPLTAAEKRNAAWRTALTAAGMYGYVAATIFVQERHIKSAIVFACMCAYGVSAALEPTVPRRLFMTFFALLGAAFAGMSFFASY